MNDLIFNYMSYTSTSGYKNDVFVSYAHADNEPMLDSKIQWVSNFVDDLGKFLAKKLGRKEGQSPFVWIDDQLALNKPLNESLSNELKQTATYLVIMSPAYLESDWCKEERKQFFNILKGKGSNTRVFIIEIDEIDRKKYPLEINEYVVPYKFWKKENGSKPRILGFPKRENDDDYSNRLIDVSTDLANELVLIKSSIGPVIIENASKGSVFLAQVTDDLDEKRAEVKRYLKDSGYRILPEESWYLTEDPDDLKENIKQNLAQCSLYVQLLSGLSGKKIPNSDDYLTEFQFEIAKKANKNIMVWRASNLNLEEVSSLGLRKILESEYARTGIFEEFKSAIITALTPPQPSQQPLHPSNSKFVYICTDAVDKEYCENIILKAIDERNKEIEEKKMGQKNKIDCFFPLENAGSPDARKYNDDSFLISDAALFVYCNSDASTVLNQINYCRKVNVRRSEPFEIVALYDGPPPVKNEIPIRLASLKFTYLNCRESLKDFTEKFLNLI